MLKEIDDENLELIIGGASTNISSSIINALVNVVKFFYDVGSGVGSALRRFHDKDMCPTK